MLTIILLAIIFILIELLLFILGTRSLTSEEEFEAKRKIISYKMNKIFKGK
jgi:hypothetical protein